jgi:hypothetical protein
MNERIDIIKPHVRHFCKKGYLDENHKKTLYDLSEQYQIPRKDVDDLVKEELKQVKIKQIELIYQESGQPDSALHDHPDLFPESKRQFPDMLNIGKLHLSLNDSVEAPAFIPIRGCCGVSLFYENQGEDEINNFIQNLAVRLILSLPRGLSKLTLIDPINMGGSFIKLSGLDKHFIRIIDDGKAILPFLQECSRDMASFNFNELGSKYADINAYNRANRSKARPYHIVLCSSLSDFDDNAFRELERIFRTANKTGFFLLSAACSDVINRKPVFDALKKYTCVINQYDKGFEVTATVDLTLFNKGFYLYPEFSCIFDSETIFRINNEYDSQAYPITKKGVFKGNEPARDMEIVFAQDEEGNEIPLLSKQMNDNVLFISEQSETIDLIIQTVVVKFVDTYGDDEIRLMISNSEVLPENSNFSILDSNVHSNKYHYTYGLLKQVEAIVVKRKDLFQEQKIDDFQLYNEAATEKLPRIICIIDNIDTILDNDNLIAEETVQILDRLLTDSVKYGIHFLVAGIPTDNLLKMNLNAGFNYKIFVFVQSDLIELVTSKLISDEDVIFASKASQGIEVKESSNSINRLSLTLYKEDELEDKIKQLALNSSIQEFSKPVTFVDYSDEYPDAYKQISIKDIPAVENHVTIGIPRFYSNGFYSLPITKGNLLIMGDDKQALDSLLASFRNTQFEMLVCDVSDSKNNLVDCLSEFIIKKRGDVKNPAIVYLLNMDEFDYTDINKRDYLRTFVANTPVEGIYLLFHTKNSTVFQTGNLGEITRTCFEHKIALKDSPDSEISPILYLKNSDFIQPPKNSMEIIYEGTDSISCFGIDNVWLFNNEE